MRLLERLQLNSDSKINCIKFLQGDFAYPTELNTHCDNIVGCNIYPDNISLTNINGVSDVYTIYTNVILEAYIKGASFYPRLETYLTGISSIGVGGDNQQ